MGGRASSSRRGTSAARTLLVAAVALLVLAASAGASPRATSSVSLSPKRFEEISSGVTLIHTFSCGGRRTGSGTGFLIGDRIVMTARHVVDPPDGTPACRTRVRVKGTWINVQSWNWWYEKKAADGRLVDLAVLKLKRRVDAYLFRIRPTPVRIGTNVAAVGHPLGNALSVTQGRLVARRRIDGVPRILVNLLGAEGASGSPFVDNNGNVVGILQQGLTNATDAFGQTTSGAIVGLDLNSWWGSGKRDLCRAYPNGGIPMCNTTKPTPPPPPLPACGRAEEAEFFRLIRSGNTRTKSVWNQWANEAGSGHSPLLDDVLLAVGDLVLVGTSSPELVCTDKSRRLQRAVAALDAPLTKASSIDTQLDNDPTDPLLEELSAAMEDLRSRLNDLNDLLG